MNKPYVIDFKDADTIETLAYFIGMNSQLLSDVTSASPEKFYRRHEIKKRGSRVGTRVCFEAKTDELAGVYKRFARRFDSFVRSENKEYPHECAFGYIQKKSTYDNAFNHCGNKVLLRADIDNFFPSISINRIVNAFLKLGLNKVEMCR